MSRRRVVVALGGNGLLRRGEAAKISELRGLVLGSGGTRIARRRLAVATP